MRPFTLALLLPMLLVLSAAPVRSSRADAEMSSPSARARSPEDSRKLPSAQKKGVILVATARTQGGRVQDTPRRREANIVPGDNLPAEKARLLLQLALTKTRDLGEIARIFNEY